jgi:glycosyltransferase involved in cell wall biosynthesis
MTDLPFWFPIINRAKNRNLVLTIHDVAPSVANKTEAAFWGPFTKFLLPEMVKKFRCVIVPSPSQSQFLKNKGCEISRVSLIPLCYDEQVSLVESEGDTRRATRYRYGIEPDDFVIISVGRLIPVKRFDLLLRAFGSLSKNLEFCQIKCLIVGPDEGRLIQLIRLSEQLGISDKVHFLGKKTHLETLRLIKAADLFVMPSADEAFNLSTIESMALSLPVLVSSGVGASYLIKDSENGFKFERNDLESLKESLSYLVKNRHNLRLLALEGKKTAESFCSPRAVSEKYLEVYRRFAA